MNFEGSKGRGRSVREIGGPVAKAKIRLVGRFMDYFNYFNFPSISMIIFLGADFQRPVET
jgi:hypothetical protein